MCGINGFNWNDKNLILNMNSAISHRGPDNEGIFTDKNISLGHRRLSIIDLSESGNQPMNDIKDKYQIVYNGEVYNFQNIKEELVSLGYSFNSNSDTEVILYSYIHWGNKCVEKFNGMWAFAIYDKTKNIIFLSRDRFGIKPLFYYQENDKFIFSSEIKGILKHNIDTIPNDTTLFSYLYYGYADHSNLTFFENIYRLPAGHNGIFELQNKNFIIKPYYNIKENIYKRKEDNQNNNFLNIFKDSVNKRLIADVEVGSCLSGGLDSSAIVCTMKELNKKQIIKTFSLIFNKEKFDESDFQIEVAKKCNVERYTTSFTEDELLEDLDDLIYTQEEPFETLSIYGQYKIMQLANKKGIKVLLDGQGSDEILGGYHWLFPYYFLELFHKRKFIKLFKIFNLYYKTYHNKRNFMIFATLFLPDNLKKIFFNNKTTYLNNNFKNKMRKKSNEKLKLQHKNLTEISIFAETVTSLPHLLRFEDKNSMRWSIESRVPFVDHNLVEFILSQNSDTKIKETVTKHILRESMKEILPEKVRNRKDKMGFLTPDDRILRSKKGKELAETIFNSEQFKKRKYWNNKKIINLFNEHIEKKKNHGEILWKVILTELWLKKFFEVQND